MEKATRYAKTLVDACDLPGLDNYLASPEWWVHDEKQLLFNENDYKDDSEPATPVSPLDQEDYYFAGTKYDWDDDDSVPSCSSTPLLVPTNPSPPPVDPGLGLYQLLTYAISTGNVKVIDYLATTEGVGYAPFDGLLTPLQLAIYTHLTLLKYATPPKPNCTLFDYREYIAFHSNQTKYHITEKQTSVICMTVLLPATVDMVNTLLDVLFTSEAVDYNLMTLLIDIHHLDLKKLYHSSVVWAHWRMYEFLMVEYKTKIVPAWIEAAAAEADESMIETMMEHLVA